MTYFKSEKINVFPCTTRGTNFNPNALVPSEYALTHLGNSDATSYIINYDTQTKVLKCVIGGYYFEITTELADINNKYLNIKIAKPATGANILPILAGWESSYASLDMPQPNTDPVEYKFIGLAISDNIESGATAYLQAVVDNAINRSALRLAAYNGSGAQSLQANSTTVASGDYSAAFGEYTIASGNAQLVFGKYNVADSAMLEIVGNGTSATRTNARTLDTAGNEILAGNLSVNGDISAIGNASAINGLTINGTNINSDLVITKGLTATTTIKLVGAEEKETSDRTIENTDAVLLVDANSITYKHNIATTKGTDGSATNKFISAIEQDTIGQVTYHESSLSAATDSAFGGIKLGYTPAVDTFNYPVVLDATGKAYVTVGWTDTHNQHAIISGVKADETTAIEGTESATKLTLGESGVIATNDETVSVGPNADVATTYDGTFVVPNLIVNKQGIVVGASDKTITMPASDNTWRPVYVYVPAYEQTPEHWELILGDAAGDHGYSMRLKAGDNVQLNYNTSTGQEDNGYLTIGATDTLYQGDYNAQSKYEYVNGNIRLIKDYIINTEHGEKHEENVFTLAPSIYIENDINAGGTVTANNFYGKSDARLKENIIPFEYQKSILDLPIYKFDYINGSKNNIGCLAQDLQKLYPELVTENKEGYLTIAETKLVYLLIEEIKNLKKELKELKK